MAQIRYFVLCALSGLFWGGIAYVLMRNGFPGLWAGIAVSPLIGLLIGLLHRPTYSLPIPIRIFLALVTLYLAVALFGLVVGAAGALTEDTTDTNKGEIVVGYVFLVLWGMTVTGYLMFLWPLAFANHWFLGHILHRN